MNLRSRTKNSSSAIALVQLVSQLLLPTTSALNGDPAQQALVTYSGWKAFEVITQYDQVNVGGYAMRGKNDGLGAYVMDNGDLRVFINHESYVGSSCDSNAASISEVIIDTPQLHQAINNAIGDSNGLTGGVPFIKSIGRAYNRYRTKDGTEVASFGGRNFERFCSGQVFEANTYGFNIGFVDRLYIFGEEVNNDQGRIFAIHENTLHFVTGSGSGDASSLQGGINGVGYDSLENAALVSTGEQDHVALFLSPDFGSETLRMYIGKKGYTIDGQSCGACAGDENLLARNGLAFGSWFYLEGSFPGNSGDENAGSFGTNSNNAMIYPKHEDVDTNPTSPWKVVLANQLSGVFEFDFRFDFTGGSFSSETSSFAITKILSLSDVPAPDNIEWAGDGSIFVNNDNSEGAVHHILPNDGGISKIARTVGSGESTGIIDISHLLNYNPATILLTNSMVCPASVSLLINPNAPLTDAPTVNPSVVPSTSPSQTPSTSHPTTSNAPSQNPSAKPSLNPSVSLRPSTVHAPSDSPSSNPTDSPTSSPSNSPSRSPTKSPSAPFVYKGNNGSPSAYFPLGRCEGDCDDDSECADGLLCFQRSGNEEVPGCVGVAGSGTDYCFARPSDNYLYNAGDNGNPSVQYPLGKCQGDCDSNSECAEGLVCFQRGGTEEVPGCEGLGVSGKDYCYDPNPDTAVPTRKPSSTPSTTPSVTKSPSSKPSASPSQTPSFVPTAVPSSKSSHMPSQNPSSGPMTRPSLRPSIGPSALPSSEPSTSPTQHPAHSLAPSGFSVPSMLPSKSPSVSPSSAPSKFISQSPSANPSGHPASDSPTKNPTNSPTKHPTNSPTKRPSSTPLLTFVGNDGGDMFPLGRCEGDCDNDSECKDGLLCFQRSGNEEVPGCEGVGDSGIDYCFERPSENYLYNAGDNGTPSVQFPLGKCQGDCDSNSDCAEGLVCFERSGTEEVPGCEGLGVSGKDYCYEPAPLPFSYMGNNGSPSNMFPLGRCEGDCDDDNECDDGLLCFQRSRTEEVPGCEGVGDSGIDYCFRRPSDNYLYNAGDNGKPSVKYPLGKCEGDCDSDDECSDGLKCFQRRGTQDVPGCEGLGVSGKDYCYDPSLFV